MKGLIINSNNDEIVIKGSKDDLLELSNYINNVANKKENNHLHLDDLTIIDSNSNIKNLIIEKEENNE